MRVHTQPRHIQYGQLEYSVSWPPLNAFTDQRIHESCWHEVAGLPRVELVTRDYLPLLLQEQCSPAQSREHSLCSRGHIQQVYLPLTMPVLNRALGFNHKLFKGHCIRTRVQLSSCRHDLRQCHFANFDKGVSSLQGLWTASKHACQACLLQQCSRHQNAQEVISCAAERQPLQRSTAVRPCL